MRVLRVVLILLVALAIASPILAQEKKRGKKGGAQARPDFLDTLLQGVSLSDEEKAKVADVKKEFGPKLAEAQKKVDGIFTDEQKKARAEAMKEAKAAGKSGREAFQAVEEATKATDEQKSKRRELEKERFALQRQMTEKVLDALTGEHKEEVQKKLDELKKRGGGKKKRD